GSAGGGEDDVLAGRKVGRGIDLLFVLDAHAADALFELRRINYQAGEDLAIQAAHGGSGDHAFGSASDSHDRMHARAQHRSGNAGGEIAITDQANTRSGGANVVHQLFVPRTVQHNHDQVFYVAIQAARDVF